MSDLTNQEQITEQVLADAKKATRKRKVADLMDPNQEKPKRAAKKQKVSTIINTINANSVGTNIVTAGSVTNIEDAVITQHGPNEVTFQKGGMFIRCKGQSVDSIPWVVNGRQFTIIRRDFSLIPDSESSSDSDSDD